MHWRLDLLLLLSLPAVTAAAGFESDKDAVYRGQRMYPSLAMDPRPLDYTGMCGYDEATNTASPCTGDSGYARHKPSGAVRIPARTYTGPAMMSMWPIEHCQTVILCSEAAASTPTKPVCRTENTVRFHPGRFEVHARDKVYRYGLPFVYWQLDSSLFKFKAWDVKSAPKEWTLDDLAKATTWVASGLVYNANLMIFTSSPYCLVRFLPMAGNTLNVNETLLLNPATVVDRIKDVHGLPSHYDAAFNAQPTGTKSKALMRRAFSTKTPNAGLTSVAPGSEEDCCPNFFLPPDLNEQWGEVMDSVENTDKSAYVNEYKTNKAWEKVAEEVKDYDNTLWSFRSFRLELKLTDQCEWIKICLDYDDAAKVCDDDFAVLEINPSMNMFIPFHSNEMREFAVDFKTVGFLRFTLPRQHVNSVTDSNDYKMIEMSYGHTSNTQALFTESMLVPSHLAKTGKHKINIVFPSVNKCHLRLVNDFDETAETQAQQPLYIKQCTCHHLKLINPVCTSRSCNSQP